MRYGVWIVQPDGSLKAGESPRAEQHKKLGIYKAPKRKASKPVAKPPAKDKEK